MTLKSLYGCSGKHRQVLGRWMYLLVEKPTGRPLFANTTTGLARVAGELGEALAGSFSRKLNQDDKNLPRFSPLSTPIHVQLTRNKVVCFCGCRPEGVLKIETIVRRARAQYRPVLRRNTQPNGVKRSFLRRTTNTISSYNLANSMMKMRE